MRVMSSQGAVADAADLRTATFPGKRNRDNASKSGVSKNSSTQSTPRKRLKRGEQRDLQDMQTFVPHGGVFSTDDFIATGEREADSNTVASIDESVSSEAVAHLVQDLPSSEGERRSRRRVRKKNPVRDRKLPNVNFDVPIAEEPSQIPSFRDVVPTASFMGSLKRLPVRENREYFKSVY